MKYELIVDWEWIYEGTYEDVESMAMSYWTDPDFYGNIEIMTEEEFKGGF